MKIHGCGNLKRKNGDEVKIGRTFEVRFDLLT
jgi:hypothetical protein